MSRQALELALEALERSVATCFDQRSHDEVMGRPEHFVNRAITAIKEALAQPEQEPVAKLQVTLEDRPIDIELAQYKRMFETACSELGAINEALGLDPNDGGAEPILFAIEQLRGEPQEPVAWMVYTLDGQSVCVTDNPTDFTPEHRALPLYTTPPQRKPLTDEEIEQMWERTGDYDSFARAIEIAHGIKE